MVVERPRRVRSCSRDSPRIRVWSFLAATSTSRTASRSTTTRRASTAPSRIVQLTSSPARNQFKAVVKLLLRQNAMLQRVETEYSASPTRVDRPSSLDPLPTGTVRIARTALADESLARPRAGRAAGPRARSFPSDKPPDWRWRLTVQRDPRPETALPTALRQQLLGTSQELERIRRAPRLPRHRRRATRSPPRTRFEFLRQMVFKSNIGHRATLRRMRAARSCCGTRSSPRRAGRRSPAPRPPCTRFRSRRARSHRRR